MNSLPNAAHAVNTAVNPPQISCDHFPALTVPAARTPRQQYHAGYQAFFELEPISILTTDAERKGYMAACKDCAYAEVNAYLVGGKHS